VRQVLYGPGSPTVIAVGEIERYFDRAQRDKLTGLRKQVDQWRAPPPEAPPRAMTLAGNPSPSEAGGVGGGDPRNPPAAGPPRILEGPPPQREPSPKEQGRR